jgi:tetratricopeptide (TPR) repeat protein
MPGEPSIHPFPGLRPFEANEEHLFFGREGQSEEILRRLRQHRFLAIVGSSGSGKSSLVRAGLLPYLYGGFLADGGSHWRVAIFRPGGDPLGSLAAALNDPAVLGQAAAGSDAAAQDAMLLEVSLRRSGLGLIEAVRLARLPDRDQVLVVVDQFEELFRLANAAGKPGQEEDAAAFVKLLMEASAQSELPIYVVLTMRSDFIGDCARYRDLPEAVTSGLYLIPRMTRDQRRAAIVEPVRVGGGTIAPRLVVRLLNDVGDDPDQLPILQHALMRCWDYWTAHGGATRPIDVDDYLAIGGMAEALSQHADEAYDGLPDDHFRALTRRIFQALTEKGPDNREARRPTTVGTLAEVANAPVGDVIRIADEFRQPGRSFLMPPASVTLDAASLIDISHESLIRGWKRLRQWVEEEAESVKIYRRLAETAALYELGTAGLWHDPDLAHALSWRDTEHPNATWADRYYPGFARAMVFLEKSEVARDAEQRLKESKRRRALAASLVAASVLGVVAVFAVLQWLAAQKALKTAAQERDNAQQGMAALTQLADSLVFNTMEQFRLHGRSQEARQMSDQVIQSYDQVIKIAPTAQVYTSRGAAYYDKGDLKQAIADYSQAVALDPKDSYAYNDRGAAYDDQNDYTHAIADYTQAIALDPNYTFAYSNRGNTYRHMNDLDHAIADYSQAITLDPKFAAAYANRGLSYHNKGDLDHAIADYDQAITLDPSDDTDYVNRGLVYYDKKAYDSAIADYDQAITLDPKYALAYEDRGLAYRDKGDLDHAIADFSQAIKFDPNDASAFVNRGYAYSTKNDLDHAIADYSQAITLDPKNALAFDSRGLIFRDKGDLDHAIADFSQAIALDPKYTYAYYNRGNAYYSKADGDHAMADYSEVITLDPTDAAAYNDRCWGHVIFDRQLQQALSDCNESLRIRPNDADTLDSRGFAYLQLGQLDEAIADFNAAIAINSKLASSLYGRGLAKLKKNDLRGSDADMAAAAAIRADIAAKLAGYGIK